MGMPAHARRWTAAEVRELTDDQRHWPRYELIDGELLVTPAPRPVHQIAVGLMFRAIADYVDTQRLGLTLTSPSDLELEEDTVTQPDVFVVPRVYSHGVPEYWIVDLDARVVERWQPAAESPELLRDHLEWQPNGSSEPMQIDLIALFAATRYS